MGNRWRVLVLVTLLATARAFAAAAEDWPKEWQAAWTNPTPELRPLQIVHGIPDRQANVESMQAFKAAGLGGMACNVNFKDYLRSDENWATLVRTVDACRQAGLVVWIYDEEGYPSAAAGGMVLKADPSLEAQVLAHDPSVADGFLIRRAYEFTHASNNVYAKRRYPNLLEPATTQLFIEKTHQAYWQRLEKQFGGTVKAFFTDEPSLMAVHLGDLNARVVDPVDPNAKPLPTVPWCSDLPRLYQERYQQDLMPLRLSLFQGNTDADRVVRRQFWMLVADLLSQRYFGHLQEWCHGHRVASSGHILWEEAVLHHVPLYGNAMKSLRRMDIPGLDVLSSDPMSVIHGDGWLTALLPASAALLEGRRKVMTEVSDYIQQGKSDLPQMQATAAWQAALGVTEYTLYYGSLGRILDTRTSDEAVKFKAKYHAYCDFVGRLNALLREAHPNPNVLLYYPIYDLSAEYLPVAGRLEVSKQSPAAQRLVRSFLETGRRMTTAQLSFAVADHELLASAKMREGGLWIGGQRFDAVVLPAGAELPESAAAMIQQFKTGGGAVLRAPEPGGKMDMSALRSLQRVGGLEPACDHVVVGRFVRQGRRILVLANVGSKAYTGHIGLTGDGWDVADPASGQIRPGPITAGKLELTIPAQGTLLVVGPSAAETKPLDRN